MMEGLMRDGWPWSPVESDWIDDDPPHSINRQIKRPGKIRMRLERVENEGTIAEARTYVPVEPVTLESGQTFTFVLPADDDPPP